MEFVVVAPCSKRQLERERIVMQAVIEAAETVGADRIVKRRVNVFNVGVYFNDGREKTAVYNDWDRDWNWKKIYNGIMASIHISSESRQECQIQLTS